MNKVLIISSVAALVVGAFFLGGYCKTSCNDGICKSENNSEMKTDSIIDESSCGGCGKNSCDKSCSTNPNDSTKLLASCSFSKDEQTERMKKLKGVFFDRIKEIKELETGYDLIFKEDIEYSKELIEIINVERQCCSGMTWALVFDPNNSATHVQVYGSKEIKEEWRNALKEVKLIK
jgi:hypothetical protein